MTRIEVWPGMAGMGRRRFLQYGVLAAGSSIVAACSKGEEEPPANAPAPGRSSGKTLDRITFGTNWFAQAEHGGFYQAVATDIYKDHGLDVTIKMGGPQVNGTQLLMGGAIDFFMGYGSEAIKAIQEGIPKVTVAAIFQKDPQVLIAHPNTGHDKLESLKGAPIYISTSARTTYWPFLKAKYGFTDSQARVYNFNPAPFLADKTSAQQGYLTSEPYAIEKQGGFKPVVFLLADFGYTSYTTTIEATRKLTEEKPDLVQRFVDASIKGWYSYLENPAPANALIKKDNPNMTDDQIDYGLRKLKEYGVIMSGDAEALGIGAMNEARWKALFESMVQAGIVKAETKYQEAFTLKYVNKGVAYYKGKQ
ncbi:nitrate ABC transporter substrate-binding protein [Leptolyngbya sp. 'hensonii']|uniref:ABC transporter substrate-binding protein n=1 Tax=Leptolyngbya sp. 'hensonii' TaxID=1922337 RepID=UPI00094FD686|nr:ABC transporter substrate-binding protein [Leptolyngbya sp. 'hensonii']OLP15734.1 nitrate ABC transporter substrate-binding protein [Leptolyngbya sp. 'hensonii']